MPAPQASFEVFVARFNPRPHAIPTHFGLLGCKIGEHRPGMFVASLPMHEQGTRQAAGFACKALHLTFPTRARRGRPAPDPVKDLLAHGTFFDPLIDAPERMPTTRAALLNQPASIPA